MKRTMHLGVSLSKQEQKAINGGQTRVICVCGNGTGIVCTSAGGVVTFNTAQGCYTSAQSTCGSSGTTCSISTIS